MSTVKDPKQASVKYPVLNAARLFALLVTSFVFDSLVSLFRKAVNLVAVSNSANAAKTGGRHERKFGHSQPGFDKKS